jgi:tripartite-type tricarboxylate transporter receptor subunit TctC
MAPKGTPRPVLDRLNGAINKIIQEPDMKKNLDAQGMVPSGGTPEKFDKRNRGDYERWVRVVRDANIKVE